jgi:hypothetical protein
LLWLAAIPAYLGYAIHWPVLWATEKAVPRETTPLHSLGSKRLGRAIGFTLALYALLAGGSLIAGIWMFGFWGIPLALGVVSVVGFCGLAASRYFRSVNLLLRSALPSRRRFRRYRQLGDELFQRLEDYRTKAEQEAAAS